jgi:hypothetical protein
MSLCDSYHEMKICTWSRQYKLLPCWRNVEQAGQHSLFRHRRYRSSQMCKYKARRAPRYVIALVSTFVVQRNVVNHKSFGSGPFGHNRLEQQHQHIALSYLHRGLGISMPNVVKRHASPSYMSSYVLNSTYGVGSGDSYSDSVIVNVFSYGSSRNQALLNVPEIVVWLEKLRIYPLWSLPTHSVLDFESFLAICAKNWVSRCQGSSVGA